MGDRKGEDKEGLRQERERERVTERERRVDKAGLCKVHGTGPRFGLTRVCARTRRRSRRLFSLLSLLFPHPPFPPLFLPFPRTPSSLVHQLGPSSYLVSAHLR